MTFSAGGKVHVKDDSSCWMSGQEVTITRVTNDGYYGFKNDNGICYEHEDNLEEIGDPYYKHDINPGDTVQNRMGSTGVVKHVIGPGKVQLEICKGDSYEQKSHVHYEDGQWDYLEGLVKIGTAAGPGTTNKLNEEPQDMSAYDTIKSAKLDQDTRLLQAQYLEDSQGHATSDGQAALYAKLWDENRTAIATDLRKALKTIANEKAALTASITADEAE